MIYEIRFDIGIKSSQARLMLTAGLLLSLSVELGSETIEMSTVFPSPSGIYNAIITTGDGAGSKDTVLNRNGGNTILVPATNATGMVGIGTDSPTAKLTVSGGAIDGNYALLPKYANWKSYGEGDGGAAIYNSNEAAFQSLMIVGNNSVGNGFRYVSVWDNLNVAVDAAVVRDLYLGRDFYYGGELRICTDVPYGLAADGKTACPNGGTPVMVGGAGKWYAHDHPIFPISPRCNSGSIGTTEHCDFAAIGVMRCCGIKS